MVEPYFDRKDAGFDCSGNGGVRSGIPAVVGGTKEVTTYFQLFDYDIALLTKAFQANQ